jgi:hypothetical protein
MHHLSTRTRLLAAAITLLLCGCYESFVREEPSDGAVVLDDGSPVEVPPEVVFSDGYELRYESIPSAPWLDAPRSGAECWPVAYSPRFPPDAAANLERALESWEAPCTRVCFQDPVADSDLDPVVGPAEGLGALYFGSAGPPLPQSAGMNPHGFFGELRTEWVMIHVGTGRSPSVQEWARAIGMAMGLRVTAAGLRDGVESVLRGERVFSEGATPTDRGALCRFYPR